MDKNKVQSSNYPNTFFLIIISCNVWLGFMMTVPFASMVRCSGWILTRLDVACGKPVLHWDFQHGTLRFHQTWLAGKSPMNEGF